MPPVSQQNSAAMTAIPAVLSPAPLGPQGSLSPGRRAWLRFKSNRRGYVSLWLFLIVLVVCMFAEFISNDAPIVASYKGQIYWPMFKEYPETTFGGDFKTKTDYLDPYIRQQLSSSGNWALWPRCAPGPGFG